MGQSNQTIIQKIFTIKKILLLAILHIVFATNTFSQNAAIAKLKFEEAEEAFSDGNFQLTLSKLKDVEILLKATNPKLLHLKIVAQDKLLQNPWYSNDADIVPELKKNCALYLAKYESVPGNEEKFAVVYKISQAAKEYKIEDLGTYLDDANHGDTAAQNFIGRKLVRREKFGSAIKWFELAAKNGSVEANIELGYIYKKQFKDFATAVKYFEKSALAGTNYDKRRAMQELADLYVTGIAGEFINNEKAIFWYKKAGSIGSVMSYYRLGIIYLEGKLVSRDLNMALEYFEKGLEIPRVEIYKFYHGRICDDLCMIYCFGEETSKNFEKVEYYANKGLSFNHSFWNSYFHKYLGIIYEAGGNGVKKDYEKSFNNYLLSANDGNVQSMKYVASMYRQGNGVKKNKALAASWMEKYEKLRK